VGCVHHFEKWWRHDEAWERYDYTYGDEELQEWIPKIHQSESERPKQEMAVGHGDARNWMAGLHSVR
jgi:hypothetical protein